MDVVAITDECQTDAAIDALVSHGIAWSYITPGMSIEPAGLLELAAEIAQIAAYACQEANHAESAAERDGLQALAPAASKAGGELRGLVRVARDIAGG